MYKVNECVAGSLLEEEEEEEGKTKTFAQAGDLYLPGSKSDIQRWKARMRVVSPSDANTARALSRAMTINPNDPYAFHIIPFHGLPVGNKWFLTTATIPSAATPCARTFQTVQDPSIETTM